MLTGPSRPLLFYHTGSYDRNLLLHHGVSKLTALQHAALMGKSIQLSGSGLPPSLTYLRLEEVRAGQPLPLVRR